ncbi:MAG: hypothetical protein IJQ42_05910 [Oscillospiraceae bacterium]|nr:hypothetical protein [Oscillospiraceae bacterium]
MKRVLACLLAVLLLASLSVTAFADGPVPSVEAEKQVPAVSEAKDADGNDVASKIIITDFEDKEKLPEDAQKQLDAAAEALKDLDALVEGNEDLKKQLNGAAVDAESLFDISLADDSVKLPVELQLKLANPDHFAALVHFVDGEATLIETEAKDELASLSLEEVGTYAVLSFVDAA